MNRTLPHADTGQRAMPRVTRRTWIAVAAAGATAARGVEGGSGPEGASAPDRPTVSDAHTHFYDPSRPGGVPWPRPEDSLLHRPVMPPEWAALAEPLGVTNTIVVEASPWVEDNQWLLDLADGVPRRRLAGAAGIVGVVGNLPLGTEGCGRLIDRFAANELFRGVRVSGTRLEAGLTDAAFAADVGRLADRGLALDVNGGEALAAAAGAAARWPTLRIVVDHMGNPRITAAGPPDSWRQAVARAAAHDRVCLKVSGMPESAVPDGAGAAVPLETAFYAPWLEAAWQSFGMRRLLFGSNWPVSTRVATYAQVLAITSAFARDKGAETERWMLAGSARAFYLGTGR